MSLKLLYITNNVEVAKIADNANVDRIFIDLEQLGKEERQGHLNSVKSNHSINDIAPIKACVKNAEVLVRVNPINPDSYIEINEVIKSGADIIMLPMFTSVEQVKYFIDVIGGRTKTMLLLETPQAMVRIDDILDVVGIDEVHIGLNDLSLGMKIDFMFELLSGGIIEYICAKLKKKGIFYGFGGIARIGYGMVPAEYVIPEHYRLGSGMAILSRSFCDANKLPIQEVEPIFREGIKKIRDYELEIEKFSEEKFNENKNEIKILIDNVVKEINNKNKT